MGKTHADRCHGAAGRPRCPAKEAVILDAALMLLSERGFTRMPLDGVARAAGVSKATIHLRFRTKTELAAAALKTLRPSSAPPETGDVRADLVAQLADFAATLTRTPGMALIGTCLAEEAHTPELLQLFRECAVQPRRDAMRRLLDRACVQGVLASGADPDAVTSALLGASYADHLAGRTTAEGWAERTVAGVLALPVCP
ncbi:TetR family transcriptional regulator [Streptomyces lunaelactis]|uniref:TetR family transcriptional regulator n=1 Tax=Streptomyces lunaelactis TaxID=1535768 RepID=A0A2R4TC93_9ACTN|nr:TetR/AcrR family transcriptional regulator [Streptomyces lunaelactis]AVZ76717.1 TetR family transcriptional regulator [Streptomyces lunaelactis]NUK83575.1 TetR/AcrR family transcriptional regulator [Streptomyces lunaelactis]